MSDHGRSVSVVICTSNRACDLRQTLAALAEVGVPAGLRCELIVVDNASRDDTARVIQSCSLASMPVRYLYEEKPGAASARNAGLATAQGEIVLFTDDDVRAPYTWLQAMCGPLLSGMCEAVAGGVRLAPGLERHWMGISHRDWLASTEHERPGAPSARVSANMAISRSVLTRVPGFDTELGPGALGFGEDTLFFNQLESAGFRIGSAGAEGVVVHHCGSDRLSRSSFLNSAKKHGCSGAYLAHHWEHRAFTRPRLLLARARLRLGLWRTRRCRQWSEAEGCPEWEMQLVRDVHFYRHYLTERHRARCYDKGGLVKHALPSPPS